MQLTFAPDGTARCLYGEAIDLHALGHLSVTRASTIEFDTQTQRWQVRRPGEKTVLFSHPSRGKCLAWERENLGRDATGRPPTNRHTPVETRRYAHTFRSST